MSPLCARIASCAIFLCAICAFLHSQEVITTVAVGGPNNVPATTAAIGLPSGLATDSSGNLYLFDLDCQRLYKVTPSGQLTVVAGLGIIPFANMLRDGGPAAAANLQPGSSSKLQGVAVDLNGNVFIADAFNYRIRRVHAPSGLITTVAPYRDAAGRREG